MRQCKFAKSSLLTLLIAGVLTMLSAFNIYLLFTTPEILEVGFKVRAQGAKESICSMVLDLCEASDASPSGLETHSTSGLKPE